MLKKPMGNAPICIIDIQPSGEPRPFGVRGGLIFDAPRTGGPEMYGKTF